MRFRYQRKGFIGAAIGTAIGAAVAVVAAPIAIAAVGFGAGGIAAGSIAASMMSSAAIANGGAIAAGSLVAVLQSIGAVGMGAGVAAGVAAAGAGVGAAVGGGVGVATDMMAGKEQTAADGTARDVAEGGAENPGDVAEALANLNVDESELQPTEDLLTILVSESDENGTNVRKFSVKRSEPLQRMFDQYYNETGLSSESVIFEFNGLRLEGTVSPAQLEIEDDDVIKALRIL